MSIQTPRPTVAEFLNRKFSESGKTHDQVAKELGFDSGKVIAAILAGSVKLPVSKVKLFSQALDAEPGHLLRLVLDEYLPGAFDLIEECFGMMLLTRKEEAIVDAFRQFADSEDVVPVTFSQRRVIAFMLKVQSDEQPT